VPTPNRAPGAPETLDKTPDSDSHGEKEAEAGDKQVDNAADKDAKAAHAAAHHDIDKKHQEYIIDEIYHTKNAAKEEAKAEAKVEPKQAAQAQAQAPGTVDTHGVPPAMLDRYKPDATGHFKVRSMI
jgi:hypothetical protein